MVEERLAIGDQRKGETKWSTKVLANERLRG